MSRPAPVRIGRGGLTAPPIGYGAASLGNLYQALSDDAWPEIVPAAWAGGVRYFDVAPHYGLGLAERRLGESLRTLPRAEYVLSTKVGRLLVPQDASGRTDIENLFDVPAAHRRVRDYSRDGVMRSIEDSLDRLGLDRIDLVLVHDPDHHEREALDGAFPALSELRYQGVITSFGAGMNQSAMLSRFITETDSDVMMVAGRWTLLDRSAADDLLPLALEREVSVIAAAIFNSGILATDTPSAGDTFDYGPAGRAVVERASAIAAVARRHGSSLPELAVQFPLTHPAVAAVVMGGASAEQLARNSALMSRPVAPALWGELRDRGLIGASPINMRRAGVRGGQPVR
ncbi:aldo/keto reductase [Microbacterium aurantiacum]|uniref:aldo/keto reductase n=1 Tax=Microbacterium aurantiacum TaxID=162393 RepID=UPI000C7F7A1E|nr:aldo/keto reductase [Microbacterium aurantiacum]